MYVNWSGTGWTDLGSYALQMSTGSDAVGNPEVYIIGSAAAAYVSDNGSAFSRIGSYASLNNGYFRWSL